MYFLLVNNQNGVFSIVIQWAYNIFLISPSVRIVVTPIENTNDKMGTDRETNFTRT